VRFLLNPEVRPYWQTGHESELLAAYERVWARKKILRQMYESWYKELASGLQPGTVVEIGAGTGNFKRWLEPRRCWTVDILPGKFVDVQADALRMPFTPGSVDNIVLIDALHHLARPFEFLQSAATILRPKGRLVMTEPFVSAWGWVVWKYLHHECVDFSFTESQQPKAAWAGNAAIPGIVLAERNRPRVPFRVLSISYCEWLSLLLGGGFSYRQLLPSFILTRIRLLERCRLFRNRFLSLRVITVLEKP
jgi:SAM-dependent methyltransferase